MSQITLYIDEQTAASLREAARREGISQSQWVGRLIRERTGDGWPAEVAALGGSWADLPFAEELRADGPKDMDREPL